MISSRHFDYDRGTFTGQVAHLFFVEGLDTKVIASRLNLPESRVYNALEWAHALHKKKQAAS